MVAHRGIVSMLVLFLFYDILQNSVPCLSRNGHIAVLLELGVVAFGFLRNAVAEKTT